MRMLVLAVMLIPSLAFGSDRQSTEEIRVAVLSTVEKSQAAVNSISVKVPDPFVESAREDVLRDLKNALDSLPRKAVQIELSNHFVLTMSLKDAIVSMDTLRRYLPEPSKNDTEGGKMALRWKESLGERTRELSSAALKAEFGLASRLVDIESTLAEYERRCGKVVVP